MLLPITFFKKNTEYNGRNWPGVVIMRKNHPQGAAIWAQEAYEARYKLNPINFIKSRTSSGCRKMEILSHEIETQAAVILYGVNENEYRNKEARTLSTKYKHAFDGMTQENIIIEMLAVSAKAKRWVEKNIDDIRKIKS